LPAMAHPLDPFFKPKSVAMVGATEAAQKIAGRRWKTLVEGGFAGSLFPIHPRAESIRGHKAYRDLKEVPEPIDLAVVVVPAEAVEGVAQDCLDLNVGGVVLISGGFSESGPEGKAREADLVARMRAAGTRMVGPNCAGLASVPAKMNITGFDVPAGRVGLISQSGNLALNLSFLAGQTGGGFSRQVTIGNTADLGVVELTDFLLHDPETEVVLIYLEGWRDGEGRQLVDLVAAAGRTKPIVILNPGGTDTGRRAALSHTGALAASHRISAGAYAQAGIVQVQDIEEAWLVARSLCDLPPLAGDRLAILSDGGGHATLVCDALDRAGMRAPPFTGETRQRLSAHLPLRCAIENPVDFAGVAETEPTEIVPALDICFGDPEIDGAILVGHFGGYHTIGGDAVLPAEEAAAGVLLELVSAHDKPLFVHSVHGRRDLAPLGKLRDGGVPVTDSLPTLASVVERLHAAATRKASPRNSLETAAIDEIAVSSLLAEAAPGPPRWLMEPEARSLLRLFGVETPEFAVVMTSQECIAAIERFSMPVALKRIAPDSVHKSRQGGVALNVVDAAAGDTAFERLMALGDGPSRVLISGMISGDTEIAIGGVRDRQFGPMVMLGLGGVGIEALGDVVFRPAPIAKDEALDMFRVLKSRTLFFADSYKAVPGLDGAAALLVQISHILAARDEIAEIDLNPVFLNDAGPAIADARIVLT